MSTPAAATKTPPSTPSARPSATPELRTWTSLSGHQLEATLVELQDGQVRLRKRDGKRILIQFDQLSPEDQQYVRNWQTES